MLRLKYFSLSAASIPLLTYPHVHRKLVAFQIHKLPLLNVKKLSTSLSLVPNVKKHWATLLHLVYPPLNKHAIVFIFFRIFIGTSYTTLPISSPLLLMNPPNTFAFIPLPAMNLSSLNRSNSNTFRHIIPYSAPVCEGMHFHKTGVPWQMKSTFIIVLFLLELPRNALPRLSSRSRQSQNARLCKHIGHFARCFAYFARDFGDL